MVSKLPDRYQNGADPIDFAVPMSSTSANKVAPSASNEAISNEKQSLTPQPTTTPSSNSNEEYVEVLYDYLPQEPEDLGLRSGDKIKVLQHVSPDWWRGENSGRIGMFPANYVKPISNNMKSPVPALSAYSRPQGPPSSASSPVSQQQQYYAQPPPQQQQQQFYTPPPQQQYYQPPPQQMVQYQSSSPQPPQQVVVQEQQQASGSNTNEHLKKFGSKLGNAAIFGAGATLGADLVNSIF